MTLLLLACAAISVASTDGMPMREIRPGVDQSRDTAVDAYIEFVEGKQLKAPADRKFIMAALDRLTSAVEGLALRRLGPEAAVLSAAHELRSDLRELEPFAPDTQKRMKRRWMVFVTAAKLINDLGGELDRPGASKALRDSVTRAADSIDYSDPARFQPDAVEIFFKLAARALKQMADIERGPD